MTAIVANRSRNPAGRAPFYQESRATAAACPAHFGCLSTVLGSDSDQLVNQRSGDAGSIAAAQFPLLAQKTGNVFPFAVQQCVVHGSRDLRNPLEVAEHTPVAINVRFEYFPVVDSRLPRCARVGEHKA